MQLSQGAEDFEIELTQGSKVWGECTDTIRQFLFTGTTGLMCDFDISDPITVYSQFLTEDIKNIIVTDTNRFAHQWLAKNQVKRRCIMSLWIECDESKLKKYLAIIMVTGINTKPKIRLYWSTNPKFGNKFI